MYRFIGLLLCWCVSILVHAETGLCQQGKCLAVVDAGSTGSRLHVFTYDLDKENYPIKIKELFSKKIKPGLATVALTQDAVNQYLTGLFANISEDHMPLYFYATGGMRLISQQQQETIYQFVQQWFKNQSQWQLAEARTITGQEEGVFGWLSINEQILTNANTATKPSLGVLDMGGASVQITFPVESVEKINPDDLYKLNVNGHPVTLFAHSFLGLGQVVTTQQFFDTKSCFSNDYMLPNHSKAKGDAFFCQYDVSKIINNVHGVNHLVKQAMAKNEVRDWYAIGGVTQLVQDPRFVFENQQFTNKALLEQTDSKVCQQPWQSLSAADKDNEYLYIYCLSSAYYYALMVGGYGISPEQTINYFPEGKGSDWTLGVVLHH